MRILAIVPYAKNSFQFAHRQIEGLRANNLDVEIFYLRNRMNPFALIREFIQLRQRISAFKPNVIHAHYGSVTSLFGCLNLDLPVVITFRGSDINLNPSISRMRYGVIKILSLLSSIFADHIFCVSPEIANKMICNRKKVSILPSGVEESEFFVISKLEARNRIQASEQEKIILFNAGRNPLLKRLDIAQDVYKELKKDFPQLRLIVLQGFTPSSEVPLFINSADVLLMTSDSEGSPNVVKEAAACGVPVVSFDVGDVRSIVSSCKLSEVVPRGDKTRMIEATRRVLARDGTSRQSYLPSQYKSTFVISELIKVYSCLIARK